MGVAYRVQFLDRIGWLQAPIREIYKRLVVSSAAHPGDCWTVITDDMHAFEALIAQDRFIATWERL